MFEVCYAFVVTLGVFSECWKRMLTLFFGFDAFWKSCDFVPFKFPLGTFDPGLSYWPMGVSRNQREIRENRPYAWDAFPGPHKQWKMSIFRARYQEEIQDSPLFSFAKDKFWERANHARKTCREDSTVFRSIRT